MQQGFSLNPRVVGHRIKELRLARSLSQRQLASPGVSYAYISRVEAGQRTPSLQALIALADRLGTTALTLSRGPGHHSCPFCGQQPPSERP